MKESDAGISCCTWPTYDDAPFQGGTVLRRRLHAQQGFLCYTLQSVKQRTRNSMPTLLLELHGQYIINTLIKSNRLKAAIKER